ncbi:hypothetical protein [Lutibacter sp.]|uniref:hypothetical protein n=1 Tax=Lutibacter sp. TaxID=1925666 RepID=UPI0025B9C0EA|nr:hypothetical protein [Lutibacter sp.]MCF6168773.1 hypothetical protein [Lutibacter sp.]
MLTFVDVNDRIANKQNASKSFAKIIIVRWDEWGRKKKQCNGWGLCNAEWFPQNKSSNFSSGGATLLEFDNSLDKYYIDILLDKTPPLEIPTDALTLKIDENFDLDVQEIISQNLTFNKGEYFYDNSLSEFGGYRIYLDK